jgi:hypothetical protein
MNDLCVYYADPVTMSLDLPLANARSLYLLPESGSDGCFL